MQPAASSTALQTTCPRPTGAAATGTPTPETETIAETTATATTVTATIATAETVTVTVTTAVGLVLRTVVVATALRPGETMTAGVAPPGAVAVGTMTRAMTGEEVARGAVTKTTTAAEGVAMTALRRGITTTTGAEATVAVPLVGATRLPAVEEEEVLPVRGAAAEVPRLKALASTTSAKVVAVRLRKTRSRSVNARDPSRRGTSSRRALRLTPPSRPR